MTPERKAWWDSLPKEEKKIRKGIEDEKEILSHFKNVLKYSPNKAHYKNVISKEKSVIKALRKQIAMDVIALHNSAYEYYTCPYCGQNVKEGDVMRDEDNYCASCGQKLRWEE